MLWIAAEVTPDQQPTIPDPSLIKDLSPPVQILFLVLLILIVVLFYFGGALRDRLTRKPPETPPSSVATPPAGPVATPALDRAAEVSDQYNAYLLDQIEELKERVRVLERDNARLREDVERYRMQAAFYQPRRGND